MSQDSLDPSIQAQLRMPYSEWDSQLQTQVLAELEAFRQTAAYKYYTNIMYDLCQKARMEYENVPSSITDFILRERLFGALDQVKADAGWLEDSIRTMKEILSDKHTTK